jgi:hypothetical protein
MHSQTSSKPLLPPSLLHHQDLDHSDEDI